MVEYFNSLVLLDKSFLLCGIIGGLVFIIKTILALAGGDMDDTDFGSDSDASFQLFSVQGITIFIMMFGLSGLVFHISLKLPGFAAIIGGMFVGFVAMWILAKVMLLLNRLQSSGNMDMVSAIGQQGTVYLTIPPDGIGQVQLVVAEKLGVYDAITHDENGIQTNENVMVIDVNGSKLVVERI